MSTADYYNNNAQIFLIIHTELTCRVCTNLFKYLPTQLKILDLGCRSSGDTLDFKKEGIKLMQ